jgi:hypothetical protein
MFPMGMSYKDTNNDGDMYNNFINSGTQIY